MRYRPEHKVEIHRKIVKDASRRVRTEGLKGAAVGAVMRDTGLTQFHLTQIEKSLRWVVSVPLRSARGVKETLAVLSVDGLGFPLELSELMTLYQAVKSPAQAVAGELDQLRKSRVTITVEDLTAGA